MGAGLLAAIATLAAPVARRVLIALGLSVLTLTGGTAAVTAWKTQIVTALGQAPLAALQLTGLAGGWVGLGMVFGAITFALTLWGLTKATRLVFV